jgi:pyruvate dehydrogenase E2 component (dihydrolipoamide acetyltransferase)
MSTLRMPRLSDSMEEATISAWLKQPGDTFRRGEPLVEVETDKATVVYEAEADGELSEILVPEGGTARLGAPIARLAGAEDDDEPSPVVTEPAPAAVAKAVTSAAAPSSGGRARATPVARRTAVELGVGLHALTGTGPGGRIRKLDVVRAGSIPNGNGGLKGATTPVPLSPTRATVARRMSQSRSEIPTFDVSVRVDLSTILELRREVEGAPSVNDFVVKAAAVTLRRFPEFNSSFVEGRTERHARVNVGVAVAADDGLFVPAVLDADEKPLGAIAHETRELAQRAKSRHLTPDELGASTFTVSNLGMFGVESFTAVINPPQVAILAVGAAARTPVEAATGGVEFRDTALLTLSSDHRAVYGADAARFMAHLRHLLEHPLTLLL